MSEDLAAVAAAVMDANLEERCKQQVDSAPLSDGRPPPRTEHADERPCCARVFFASSPNYSLNPQKTCSLATSLSTLLSFFCSCSFAVITLGNVVLKLIASQKWFSPSCNRVVRNLA